MCKELTTEEMDKEIYLFRAATLEKAGGKGKVRCDILPTLKLTYSYYGRLDRLFSYEYKVRIAFTFPEWVRMYQGYFPDNPEKQIKRGSIRSPSVSN